MILWYCMTTTINFGHAKEFIMNILSWSGGKDSTASLILCHEHKIPIDYVIFSEVMFDNSRNISGENPDFMRFVKLKAIPIIQNMGYEVIIVHSNSDYVTEFNHIVTKSKHIERNGKRRGFVLGGMCKANSVLKVKPIHDFLRKYPEAIQIIGIAADETKRLKRLKNNQRSILAEFNIKEIQTFDICRKYGLLNPLYSMDDRCGCWFCPNQSIRSFAELYVGNRDLWNELEKLSLIPDTISKHFKYTKTFAEVKSEVLALIERERSI